MAMIIKVGKFEKFPLDVPVGYSIGFAVDITNAQGVVLGGFYRETIVPIADCAGKTDEEILVLAWDYMKHAVRAQRDAIKARHPLVGTIFNPTT